MMHSYHIHIKGLVQGVGFRPFVAHLAHKIDLPGWVANTNDGVHIEVTGTENDLKQFQRSLLHHAPARSIITEMRVRKIEFREFDHFEIRTSCGTQCRPDLLPSPDIAICPACRNELLRKTDARHNYPFITCVHCGPRYSIVTQLPYDRITTTMAHLPMCGSCEEEYNSVSDRRYHSQTNSCHECSIPMHLHDKEGCLISSDADEILKSVQVALCYGSVVAVKGVGGYLLLADATNEKAIKTLRERKHRPSKPFAVLYDSCEEACEDVLIQPFERSMLEGPESPIVLCNKRKHLRSDICFEMVAPGLQRLGIMLPYTGLLKIITSAVKRPLIATSANLSGAPLIYRDAEALKELGAFADLILVYDREIVTPQDDSVVQFTSSGQMIFLRRSRGFAPNLFPDTLMPSGNCMLGMGADMKGTFALKDDRHLFVSQYLGDQQSLEAQEAYNSTLKHLTDLLKMKPEVIVADKHPGYASTSRAIEIAQAFGLKLAQVQHHKAHFAAVLAEHKLIDSNEPVLGVIWDGTGWGDDGQIWGGEFFKFENTRIERAFHWAYFTQMLGDKMSKEPRLSALSLLSSMDGDSAVLKNKFDETEYTYYKQLLLHEATLKTCSVGRLIDGLSCLLGLGSVDQYEGEAAMKLEALAMCFQGDDEEYYHVDITGKEVNWQGIVAGVLNDCKKGTPKPLIAKRIWRSFAHAVKLVATISDCKNIAFSGGVFQNSLLVQLIHELMGNEHKLYFNERISPNDESIAFGQIAYELYGIDKVSLATEKKEKFKLAPIAGS